MALIDKILRMQELDAQMEELKAAAAILREEYDKLRLHDIPNEMAEQDTTSLKGAWGRCTLTTDLNVRVKDKLALHKHLEDEGAGDLIVPTVNAQTLKSWVKEQMGSGTLPLPVEIAEISPFSRAVLYKN